MFSSCSRLISRARHLAQPGVALGTALGEDLSPGVLGDADPAGIGLVQKSLIVFILPSFSPSALTMAGVSPVHW